MKTPFLLSLICLSFSLFAQNCGIQNPGFERYKLCPSGPSQTDLTTVHWFNALDNNISTSDYFNENHTCNFGEFTALRGIAVDYCDSCFLDNCFYLGYQGCGRAGVFLNYYDGIKDSRYKEFLGTRVDIINGRNYTLEFDIQLSSNPSTDSIVRDLCIYGYNGLIPAPQLRYNPVGAVALDTISRALFNTYDQVRLTSTFTPASNFSYLLVGPVSDDSTTNFTGYVYLDNFILSDASGNTLTPLVQYINSDSRDCCFSGGKQDFRIVGNRPPAGTLIRWGQKTGNPETLTFITPGDTSSIISGTGPLLPGMYTFYYTWTKGSCSVTDTFDIMIYNRARANAGSDMVFCNSGGSLTATSPNFVDLFGQSYLAWWSAIDRSVPGNVFTYTLPITAPRDGSACKQGPFPQGNSFGLSQPSYPTPNPFVSFRRQADTATFIWNVIDQCQTYSADTVKAYMYQLRLRDTTGFVLCPGDTSIPIIESTDSVYNFGHRDRRNWLYYWTFTSDSGVSTGGRFVGNPRSSSIRFVGTNPGTYTVALTVIDTTNTLCDTLRDFQSITIVDTSIYSKRWHESDKFLCNQNRFRLRYITAGLGIERRFYVAETPGTSTFERLNYGETLFGVQLISSIPTTATDSLGIIRAFTDYVFEIRDFRETRAILTEIIDPCDTLRRIRDTVLVRLDRVRVSTLGIACPNDTSTWLYESSTTSPYHPTTDTLLTWEWIQTGGPGTAVFTPGSISDSAVLVTLPNIPGNYTFNLVLRNSDTTECEYLIDSTVVSVIAPFSSRDTSMSAGRDTSICMSTIPPYSYIMNASPSIPEILANRYTTWWSVLDTSEVDGEYTFTNGCVPYDGFDNGAVSVGFTLSCTPPVAFSTTAPNMVVTFADFGCFDFVWHMQKNEICDDTFNIIYRDTVRVCYGFREPVVAAGKDDTAECNIYQLVGNVSSASAANDGCFYWKQLFTIPGGGTSRAFLVDTNSNICFITGIDTLPEDIYYFEYTLGCGECTKTDTVAIYVPASLPTPNVSLLVPNNPLYLCKDDTIVIKATGASQYSFLLNGTVMTPLSPVDTFRNGTWINDTSYVQVIALDALLGCYSSADVSLLVIHNPLDKAYVNQDTVSFCKGTNTWIKGFTPIASQRIIWYSSADGYLSPINGTGSKSGDSILVSPLVFTTYKGVVFDTAGSCLGTDSITIYVNPQEYTLPNPVLPSDSSVCLSADTFDFPIEALNSLYPGYWSYRGSGMARFTDSINSVTRFITGSGSYAIIRTESNKGCLGADSMNLTVYTYPNVDAGPDVELCAGRNVTLQGFSDGENFYWMPSDSLWYKDSLLTKTVRLYNELYFYLSASNGGGLCQSMDSVFVKLVECPADIKAPDAFSPNGDGVNDFFSVFTYNMVSYEINIYNRWGELLYNSTDLNETNSLTRGWDGSYKGILQELGVYVFDIRATDKDGKEHSLQGNVTIIF